MFESSRLPHAMTKEDFATFETRIREQLLDAQFQLAESKSAAVLVLVNGSDGTGKGEVVNRLYEWLDDHFIETLTYDSPTDEERARPRAWRYWRDMTPRGRIGLILGGWHHDLLLRRALGRIDAATFEREWPRTEGMRLRKIRTRITEGDRVWEIDRFLDLPVALAECELPAADAPLTIPPWLAPYVEREVTEEPAFRNSALARRAGFFGGQ